MSDLKVTLVQSELDWENPEQNRVRFGKLLSSLSKQTDLIVLPEMFTTGFSMNPKKCAEGINGPTVEWMQKLSREKNTAVCGSIMIAEQDRFYNTFIFVTPDNQLYTYNKRHLFTLSGEHETYEAGKTNVQIEYKGWKIRPQICYDLRFPVFARNTDGYDLLLYVANWPETRVNAWDALLKARAIENLAYVVGVNRVGVDGNALRYSGHSAVYDALGNEICSPLIEEESIVTVLLEKSKIENTRRQLNFLNDRDHFKILD